MGAAIALRFTWPGHGGDARLAAQPGGGFGHVGRAGHEAHADGAMGAQPADHLGHAARGHQPAVLDDADLGADVGHFGQDVGREEDRLAHPLQGAQQLAHLNARPRVKAAGRLVEDEHLWVVGEGAGQAEALLHTPAERLDVGVAFRAQVYQGQQVVNHARAGGSGDVVAGGEEVEILPDLHVVVDAEEVGHVADGAADGDRLFGDGVAGNPRLAGGRPQQRGQDAHRRRLARAVGADEAEDGPLLDAEGQVFDGGQVAVALGDALEFDQRGH